MPFTPVTLKPLDEAQKKSLVAAADSSTKIYTITFKLAGGPISEWANTFQNVWYQANKNNTAGVSGTNLLVRSTIDGLPEAVVKIKAAIVTANQKFEEQQKLKAANEAAQKKQKDDAKASAQDALRAALDKIDYS